MNTGAPRTARFCGRETEREANHGSQVKTANDYRNANWPDRSGGRITFKREATAYKSIRCNNLFVIGRLESGNAVAFKKSFTRVEFRISATMLASSRELKDKK